MSARDQPLLCRALGAMTVAVLGQLGPVAEGQVKDRAGARLLAEAAVAGYFADWAEPSGDGSACDG